MIFNHGALGSISSKSNKIPADVSLITQFALAFDNETPEQISFNCPITSTIGSSGSVNVEYKQTGSGTWLTGHPLYRIQPTWVTGAPVTPVDSFSGSIFDLSPNTTYDVRLTLTESGQPTKTLTGTKATRSLPAVAGTPNKTITTAGNLQIAFNGLVAGDVLELANGTYNVSGLQLSNINGTTNNPIYIRGQSKTGVVIVDTTGVVLFLLEASNIVLENLTIRGSGVDSQQASSSQGIQFWSGRTIPQNNIVIRDLIIDQVDQGIECTDAITNCLVYNCTLIGNNLWNSTFLASNGVDTWNDDGICMPGTGNCAWNNTIEGFGDAFSVKQNVANNAVYFWRNWIKFTGDDAFEADHSARNVAFYDNYITNAGTLLSLDPVFGGPLYCFRNICINTFRGPYKWNCGSEAFQSGFFVYNNTVVRTEGTTGSGWYQPPNGDFHYWGYRNNILIYRDTGPMFIMDPTSFSPVDFDYNGWWADSDVRSRWNSTYYTDISVAQSSLGATSPVFGSSTQRHSNDVFTVRNPWVNTITLGSNHLTQFTGKPDLVISGGDVCKNSGVVIPGITDGFSGAAPDRGAHFAGRTIPVYGAS